MTTEEIPWLEWGADTFARAAAEQKPVLLAIGAAWCRGTEEMDRVSYRDPAVVQLVTERFIPIRIDADRRPDVSERYTLGGWPTTAFLTPAGEILGGGTNSFWLSSLTVVAMAGLCQPRACLTRGGFSFIRVALSSAFTCEGWTDLGWVRGSNIPVHPNVFCFVRPISLLISGAGVGCSVVSFKLSLRDPIRRTDTDGA